MEKEGFELNYWPQHEEYYYIFHHPCRNCPWYSRGTRAKVCHCGKEIPKELLFTAEMLGWDHKHERIISWNQ